MQFSNFKSWLQNELFLKFINTFSFILSVLTLLATTYDLGFKHLRAEEQQLKDFILTGLFIGVAAILVRHLIFNIRFKLKVKIFDWILCIILLFMILVQVDVLRESLPFMEFFNKMGYVYFAGLLYFVREASVFKFTLKKSYLNPAQLFITSFLGIIILGTSLLMLPKATHEGISFIDALFTSTSAVCVTGLIVVDTGSYFTAFGQSIIVFLIQLGGLGIMTFASYFSYFFRGQSSYENQLMLKDVTNSEKIGEVFSVLKKILYLTIGIELISAFLIFIDLDKSQVSGLSDQIFFSVFHAISAFCNAGFSTLELSFYQPEFRFDYSMHIVIALTFILGGLGFPIMLNIYKYIIYFFKDRYLKLTNSSKRVYSPWALNLNTRIILFTTSILLIGGTLIFFGFEYNHSLQEHSGFGKIVTSFFGAATPRTAGFNTVDYHNLRFSTIMITFLLMWIGASPASTGGGIKTSTFAIATLNFLSLARGKDRVEVYKREVSANSIRRAFAIISLSLVVIGTAIFLIASFDSDKTLLSIAFEAFSAYSTVGLSTGITSALSLPSKLVLIFTMFIGRVSMLTLLIAILRRVRHTNYRYPTDEILIN